MLLQDKNKGIAEIRKKDRKIYEREKCSLKKNKENMEDKSCKSVFLHLVQKKSRYIEKGKSGSRNCFCSAVVLSWNGDFDFFYGYI